MTRKVHRDDTAEVAAARKRLDDACKQVAKVLDDGERDPRWNETQELESAAIALGRLLRQEPQPSTTDVFAETRRQPAAGEVLPRHQRASWARGKTAHDVE